MNVSGLFLVVGAIATIEGCIRAWAVSPALAIAPVLGFGLLFVLLVVLGMALGSFMEGDQDYTPRGDGKSFFTAWKLVGIVFLVGSIGRGLNYSFDLDLRVTGSAIHGWTIWVTVFVVMSYWAVFLWRQQLTGTLRQELRNVSTAGPAWCELGVVAGLVVGLCSVFVLDLHPLALLWLMPALVFVMPIPFVLMGHFSQRFN